MRRLRPKPLVGRPSVSVVIPCYNYGHYLRGAVQSVLDQDGVDVDVLVIDDASPDGSGDVAEALADRYANVSVIRHPHNLGHIATYNEGLSKAQGTYALLLSADDLLAPGSLARAVALMEQVPSVGLVYGFAPPFQTSPPPPHGRQRRWSVWSGQDWIEMVCRRARNPVLTPSAVMRRSAFDDTGYYDGRLRHAADFLMWLRVAHSWDVGYIDGTDQSFYRKHGLNMHSTEWSGWLTDLETRLELFDVFFGEAPGLDLNDPAYLRARKGVARDALRMARVRLSETGSNENEIKELLRFAEQTDPDTSATVHKLRARLQSRPHRFARRATRELYDLQDRAIWQFWRRYGIHP